MNLVSDYTRPAGAGTLPPPVDCRHSQQNRQGSNVSLLLSSIFQMALVPAAASDRLPQSGLAMTSRASASDRRFPLGTST